MRVIFDFVTPRGARHFTVSAKNGRHFHFMHSDSGFIAAIPWEGGDWKPIKVNELIRIIKA